jgi:DNA-binding transcriptional MerR regulator/methylmalonyl-CoA mutase cobalamin-binding subunit
MNHYPIRAISELTGVPTTTLRAWERRYGLLKPSRTAKGHRLYSGEDIDLVKEIVKLLKSNHTISEAIRIIRNPELNAASSAEIEGHWAVYQQRMLKSIENFNEQNLDTTYNEALSIYPIDMVTQEVIIPVLQALGERWQDRDAGVAEEHFFSAFLRNKLGARLHHESRRSRGNKILVACLPGEYHELGILLFCIAAIGHGYRILYLGTDMPPSQLLAVVDRTDVAAVLLSGTKPELWQHDIELELKKNIKSANIPFMFGGELSELHRDSLESLGAYVLGSDHVNAMERMESIIPAFSQKSK